MSVDVMVGAGMSVALGATGLLVSTALSPKLKQHVFPDLKQTYFSDTLDFDQVHDDHMTLIGKTGTLTRVYEIVGCDHNICHEEDLLKLLKTRQQLWDRLAEQDATLKIITKRTSVQQSFQGQFNQPTLQKLHDKWMTDFKKTYINKHYLIIEQQQQSKVSANLLDKMQQRVKQFSAKKTDSQYQDSSKATPNINKSRFEEICHLIQTILHDYGIVCVSNHSSSTSTLSQAQDSDLLSFWAGVINNQPVIIAKHHHDIAEHITQNRIHFDSKQGVITFFNGAQTSYQAILTLNKWGEESSTLMMRELLALEGQLTFIHLVKGYPKVVALIKLEDKRRQQQLALFSAKTQEELEAAHELIEGDEASYWQYQLSVIISSDSIEELQQLTQRVQQLFTNYGVTAVREMMALEYVWRAQLPGEQTFLRPTYLLSHNLAHLMTFDRITLGMLQSDWGPGPLRYMKTVSGESYSLNLHVSEQKEALGHNIIIAPSGSGKTTLIQHLIAGALRHPDLRVFMFDRFNGTRIFTQACGGTYVDFKGQQPVQLNPLIMPDTPSNQQTLRNLLTLMAGANPDLDEIERIVSLINSLPLAQRILKNNVSALLNCNSAHYKSLKRWFEGSHASWFNGIKDHHAFDALDLRHNRLIGFEMTDIMSSAEVVAPLTYYLNQRIKDAVYDQQRHISYPHWLFYDESAPMLANSFIRDQMVKVDLQEARKRRGVVTLCFQSVQSLMDTGVSNIILDQCKTQFLFPNPNCKRETLQQYKQTFNLTDGEMAFISGEHPQAKRKPYSVLLKKPTESVILDCDLRSLGAHLKVYKSGTQFVAHVNQLQQQNQQTGESAWLDTYLAS